MIWNQESSSFDSVDLIPWTASTVDRGYETFSYCDKWRGNQHLWQHCYGSLGGVNRFHIRHPARNEYTAEHPQACFLNCIRQGSLLPHNIQKDYCKYYPQQLKSRQDRRRGGVRKWQRSKSKISTRNRVYSRNTRPQQAFSPLLQIRVMVGES